MIKEWKQNYSTCWILALSLHSCKQYCVWSKPTASAWWLSEGPFAGCYCQRRILVSTFMPVNFMLLFSRQNGGCA